jgi:hypothetical protein
LSSSCLAQKYQTRVENVSNDKHTSLLHSGETFHDSREKLQVIANALAYNTIELINTIKRCIISDRSHKRTSLLHCDIKSCGQTFISK